MLARPKFAFPPDEIAAIIAMFRNNGELVERQDKVAALPDLDDAKFVQCAVAAQADYLVTGNKRHFPPEVCGAVRVVNAAELLDWITHEI